MEIPIFLCESTPTL